MEAGHGTGKSLLALVVKSKSTVSSARPSAKVTASLSCSGNSPSSYHCGSVCPCNMVPTKHCCAAAPSAATSQNCTASQSTPTPARTAQATTAVPRVAAFEIAFPGSADGMTR